MADLTSLSFSRCDYCKDLQHEYGTAATALEGKNATLAKVDCEAQPRLCKEHHIMIYPTLQVFRGLDNVQSYSGPRKAAK
jgi:thioredoxin-like negative regulator of GroEL